MWFSKSTEMVAEQEALPGRDVALDPGSVHAALGTSFLPPFPAEYEVAYFALGCFWGAERVFFTTPGVMTTAVGYQGGFTPNPTYEEVCSGKTGHTETVLVVFDPTVITYEQLVARFYEGHDPTQGNRQGNDVGTQYRSAIFPTTPAQFEVAQAVTAHYGVRLSEKGMGPITTEITDGGPFYYAEDYHQQYLVKVPNGYCGLGGTGVSCPVGVL